MNVLALTRALRAHTHYIITTDNGRGARKAKPTRDARNSDRTPVGRALVKPALSNLLSARSLLSHKGASKMLRATGHARMVKPAKPCGSRFVS